jgi:hypothetical protein
VICAVAGMQGHPISTQQYAVIVIVTINGAASQDGDLGHGLMDRPESGIL